MLTINKGKNLVFLNDKDNLCLLLLLLLSLLLLLLLLKIKSDFIYWFIGVFFF